MFLTMKKTIALVFACLLAGSAAFAAWPGSAPAKQAAKPAVPSGPNPWTSAPVRDSAGDFSFAVVADRTDAPRAGIFEEAVDRLNRLKPAFVISVGDHIQGYTDDPKEAEAEWKEFEGIVAKLNSRFYYVSGNHDLESGILPGVWKKRRGPTYYSFVHKNVLFLVLCSTEGGWAKISPEQSEWARKALEANKSVRWTFVFMHHPMWTAKDMNGFTGIAEALKGRPATLFAGHEHQYRKYDWNGHDSFVLATTGGSNALRGPGFGEFDGIVWVSVAGKEPSVTNLTLDGMLPDDVVDAKNAPLIEKMGKAAVLQATNLTIDKDTVSSLDMQWKAVNGADIPLKVSVSVGPSCQLKGSADYAEATVAPGKEGTLGISFKSPVELPIKGLEPIRYEWKSEYLPAGKRPLVVKGEASIVFDRPCFVIPRTTKVAVDGSLGEWTGFSYGKLAPLKMPENPAQWTGKSDCSFRFAANEDKDYLYLALDVNDDSLVSEQWRDPWDQDGVFFAVMGLPLNDAQAKELGKYHWIFTSPGADAKQTILYGTQWMASGIEVACVRKPSGGWTAEVAIPAKHLELSAGRAWEKLRLNICVYDRDADNGETVTSLWWRTAWDSPDNNPGSGTFYRGKAGAAVPVAPAQNSAAAPRKDAGEKGGVLNMILGWFGAK
jgi:predicted phosphodiesterase